MEHKDIAPALDKPDADSGPEQAAEIVYSEEKFRRLFEHMEEGFAHGRMIFENGQPVDFIYLDVNPVFETLTGLRNVVGRRVTEVIPGIRETDSKLFEIYGRVASGGKPERLEMFVEALQDWFSLSVYSPQNGHFVAVFEVITRRKEAENALRESEAKFSGTFQNAPVMMAITTLEEGTILEVNAKFQSALGIPREDLIGTTFAGAGVLLAEDRQRIVAPIRANGRVAGLEIALHCRGGQTLLAEYAGQLISAGGRPCILSAIVDVTDHKQHESERDIMLKLLRLLNAPNSLHELVREVTGLLQEWSGCDAVGVRLEDGDDYPYFETRGFPARFVEAENWLCARDFQQHVLRASDGSPVLECMCGNVLRGRFDPSHPFFTENGTFWTNSTSKLLCSSTAADRQGRTRNRCNGEGYESVALVPLRTGGRTLGLLQCNDRRPGRFTPATINLLERAAGGLAIALEQRSTLEALRASERRYRLISEHTADVIWTMDLASMRFTYVSPSVLQLRGYTAEEVVGQPLEAVLTPESFGMVMDQLPGRLEALAAGEESARIWTTEVNQLRKDGSFVVTESVITLVTGGQGRATEVVGVTRDITGRKRVERELSENRSLLQAVIESTSDAIYAKDVRGLHTVCNRAAAQFVGKSPAEVLGKDATFLFPPAEAAERMDLDRRLMGAGTAVTFEEAMSTAGGERTFLTTKGPLLDAGGAPLGLFGISRDITERKKAEEQREKLNLQLLQAQKMESVGRLAGGVAHDFNNLLTVINGYGDLMLRRLDARDPFHAPVAEIRKAGGRAAELTQQLLAFSRKQVIEPKQLDLNQLISESRNMFGRLIGEDIELAINLTPAVGHVLADQGQFHQVLMNLVVNARDAMPKGGRLTIETAHAGLGQDFADTHPDAKPGEYVLLVVADTGAGMDEETRKRAFEPFFTTKGEGAGTGLGLATVYGIVQQCGGWIDIASEPGKGATFTIGLPRTVAPAVPGPPPPQPLRTLQGSETVLVVEDQDEVRKLALLVLERQKYKVLEARHGGEALAIAERHAGPIHLLLTDVVMPGVTGRELADRLLLLRPDLRVLYMSGYSGNVLARRGVLDSGVHYIAKPFGPDALAQKVREVLGEARSAARVLVVDDEDGIRGLFQQVLQDAGYEVFLAADGDRALKLVGEHAFDLVFTDLVMPVREGIETIRAIRKAYPDLKIVAISGAFGGAYLETAHALGASATLTKPVSPDQLLATVRKMLA